MERCLACEAEAVGTFLGAFIQFRDKRSRSPTAIGLASEAALHGAERGTPKRQTLHAFRHELRDMSQNRDQRREHEQGHYPPGGRAREVQAVSKAESFLDEDG